MFGWRRNSVNWGWLLLRIAIALTILTTLFLSQRFWYRSIWRATANWRTVWLRVTVRLFYLALLVLIIGSVADGLRMSRNHLLPSDNLIDIFAGLWFTSALFAYFAVKVVRVIERLWTSLRSAARRNSAPAASSSPAPVMAPPPILPPPTIPAPPEIVPDPSRPSFFPAAPPRSPATPFLSAMYGFAAERLDYLIHRVE